MDSKANIGGPPAAGAAGVVNSNGTSSDSHSRHQVLPIQYIEPVRPVEARDLSAAALWSGSIALLEHNKRVSAFNRRYPSMVVSTVTKLQYFSPILKFVADYYARTTPNVDTDSFTEEDVTEDIVDAYLNDKVDPDSMSFTIDTLNAILAIPDLVKPVDFTGFTTPGEFQSAVSLLDQGIATRLPPPLLHSDAEPIIKAIGAFVHTLVKPPELARLCERTVKARAVRKSSQPVSAAELLGALRTFGYAALLGLTEARPPPTLTTSSVRHDVAPRPTSVRQTNRDAAAPAPRPRSPKSHTLVCDACKLLGLPDVAHLYKDCPHAHFTPTDIGELRQTGTTAARRTQIAQQAIAANRTTFAVQAKAAAPQLHAAQAISPANWQSAPSAAQHGPGAPAPSPAVPSPQPQHPYHTRSRGKLVASAVSTAEFTLSVHGKPIAFDLVLTDVLVGNIPDRHLLDTGAMVSVVGANTANLWEAAGAATITQLSPNAPTILGATSDSLGLLTGIATADITFTSLPSSPTIPISFVICSRSPPNPILGRGVLNTLIQEQLATPEDVCHLFGLPKAVDTTDATLVSDPPVAAATTSGDNATSVDNAPVPLTAHPAEDPDADDPITALDDPSIYDSDVLQAPPLPVHDWDLSGLGNLTADATSGIRHSLATFSRMCRSSLIDPAGRPVGVDGVPPYNGVVFDANKYARCGHQRQGTAKDPPHLRTAGSRIMATLLAVGAAALCTFAATASCPLFFIPKGVDNARAVFNYVRFNECITNPDSLVTPAVDSVRDVLSRAKFFFAFDWHSGYHQVKLDPILSNMLTFNLDGVLYTPFTAPPGFCKAGEALQWATSHVYRDLIARPGSGVLVYFDDILAYADTPATFAVLLEDIAQRHIRHNVVISASKLKDPSTSVTWGGWLVSTTGMALTAKFLAKPDPPVPTTLAGWQQQLGALNYFAHNVPSLSQSLQPIHVFLNDALHAAELSTRKAKVLARVAVTAPTGVLAALRSAWDAVRNRPMLAHHDPDAFKLVVTDASSGVGYSAVFLSVAAAAWALFRAGRKQLADLSYDLLACCSGTWTAAQRAWPVHRQEFYAVVTAILYAPHYLLGSTFAVLCDNRDTVLWLSGDFISTLSPYTHAWAIRWLSKLSMYSFSVFHNPGASALHFVADVLSRQPRAVDVSATVNAVTLPADHVATGTRAPDFIMPSLDEIRIATSEDPDAAARIGTDGLVRDNHGRILIPDHFRLRERLLILAHTALGGHRGAQALLATIRTRFTWPSLPKDAVAFVAHCVHCMVNRGLPLSHVPLGSVPIGSTFNDVVHLDFISMGASTSGVTDILCVLDSFSKFCVLVPVPSTSAESTVNALLLHWIGLFGAPVQILTDSGPGFAAELTQSYAEIAGIAWHTTIPNVSRTHGVVERAIRDLRALFSTMLGEARLGPSLWPVIAPAVVFAFNNTPVAALGLHAPIEVAIGVPRRDPISQVVLNDRPIVLRPNMDFTLHVTNITSAFNEVRLEARNARRARQQREHARVTHPMPHYSPGDYVLVADTTQEPVRWRILAQVLSKETDYIYCVRPVAPLGPTQPAPLRRHILHIRAFDDAMYNAPAALLDAIQHYADAEYPVDDFLDIRKNGRELELLVRWDGFPESDDTWEPLRVMLKDMPAFTRQWFVSARMNPKYSHPHYTKLLTDAFRAFPQLQKGGVV